MDFFDVYSSNSIAGSGNQFYFCMPKHEIRTGRIFYRITHGGTYRYSLLFSNTIDSTYSDGSISRKNLSCLPWHIHSARVGRCGANVFEQEPMHHADKDVTDFLTLLFDGKVEKQIECDEWFWSDPIELTFASNEYLCLEITFSGEMIPYHEESLLPVFAKSEDGWVYDKRMPFAGMIGCDRDVKGKIAFWGDSITQGIGTPINSYLHWNALVAKKISPDFACWNLGIGYARANDAASLDAWWNKAKQNDIVVLCLGANDILQNQPEQQIKADICAVVSALKAHGCRIVLQTVPPFEYSPAQRIVWQNVNRYICKDLASQADVLFDVVPHLCDVNTNFAPKYGGHPDARGCEIWALQLRQAMQQLL